MIPTIERHYSTKNNNLTSSLSIPSLLFSVEEKTDTTLEFLNCIDTDEKKRRSKKSKLLIGSSSSCGSIFGCQPQVGGTTIRDLVEDSILSVYSSDSSTDTLIDDVEEHNSNNASLDNISSSIKSPSVTTILTMKSKRTKKVSSSSSSSSRKSILSQTSVPNDKNLLLPRTSSQSSVIVVRPVNLQCTDSSSDGSAGSKDSVKYVEDRKKEQPSTTPENLKIPKMPENNNSIVKVESSENFVSSTTLAEESECETICPEIQKPNSSAFSSNISLPSFQQPTYSELDLSQKSLIIQQVNNSTVDKFASLVDHLLDNLDTLDISATNSTSSMVSRTSSFSSTPNSRKNSITSLKPSILSAPPIHHNSLISLKTTASSSLLNGASAGNLNILKAENECPKQDSGNESNENDVIEIVTEYEDQPAEILTNLILQAPPPPVLPPKKMVETTPVLKTILKSNLSLPSINEEEVDNKKYSVHKLREKSFTSNTAPKNINNFVRVTSASASYDNFDPLSLKVEFPKNRQESKSKTDPSSLSHFFQKSFNRNIPAAIQEQPKPNRNHFHGNHGYFNFNRVVENPNYQNSRIRKNSGKGNLKMELDSEGLKEITIDFVEEAIEKFMPDSNHKSTVSYQFIRKYQNMIDEHVKEIARGYSESPRITKNYRIINNLKYNRPIVQVTNIFLIFCLFQCRIDSSII